MAKWKLALAGTMACAVWVGGADTAPAGDQPPMPTAAESDAHWSGESWAGHPATCPDPCGNTGCGSGRFDWLSADLLSCPGGCLGEPWSLFGSYQKYSVGGWAQLGYHSQALPTFNSKPHDLQLQQAWAYAERAIDSSRGFDIGGRIDYLYGTDGPDVQAFGSGLRGFGQGRGWDSGWERGAQYGHALPQAYLEAGYGDTSVVLGNFFSIIGYEQIAAPQNFFYSRTYSRYFSNPFTHTGVLAKHDYSPDVTVYGGYTLGWDSGFNDNGDAFLGGLSLRMTDQWRLNYATSFGRFGEAGFSDFSERGYMHSLFSVFTPAARWTYISQSDFLSTEDEAGRTQRQTYGMTQRLFYQLNDCWSLGTRFEWWNVDAASKAFYNVDPATAIAVADNAQGDFNFYAITFGLNYHPHPNVIIRPEIRRDWIFGDRDAFANGQVRGLQDNARNQTTVGIDTIFLF